jgi:hypothetical protein
MLAQSKDRPVSLLHRTPNRRIGAFGYHHQRNSRKSGADG